LFCKALQNKGKVDEDEALPDETIVDEGALEAALENS